MNKLGTPTTLCIYGPVFIEEFASFGKRDLIEEKDLAENGDLVENENPVGNGTLIEDGNVTKIELMTRTWLKMEGGERQGYTTPWMQNAPGLVKISGTLKKLLKCVTVKLKMATSLLTTWYLSFDLS